VLAVKHKGNIYLKTKKMLEVKKFGAAWCGPCRALAPILTEIKSQFNNVLFTEYDVDNEFEEATKYSIRSVPTVVVIKDGVEVERIVGLSSKAKYAAVLTEQAKN
jgi:thioredoxin 1